MSTLQREAIWGVAVLSQLVAIFLLTLLGNLLDQAHLLGNPGDTVLLPAWLALFLTPPVVIGMLFVWAWQLARPRGRPPRRTGYLAHVAGALLGSTGFYTWCSWVEAPAEGLSPWILLPTTPLAMVASVVLYLPRLLFPRLRAQGAKTSFTSGPPAR